MTPVQRDLEAADAARRQYAAAYDRHAEQAQLYRGAALVLHAKVAAHAADIALRAFRAECRRGGR